MTSPKRNAGIESRDTYIVRGTMRSADGSPLLGMRVKAFDQDVGREDLLGQAVTDENGNYQITYTTVQFRRTEAEVGGPDLIVRVYSAEGEVIARSKRKRNAKSLEVVDLVAPIAQRPQVTQHVEGRIFFDNSLPAGNVSLRFYHRGFGGAERKLGEVQTDQEGKYSLAYATDGKPVNLEARVLDAEGKEIPISATKFSVGERELLNLIAPSKIKPLDSEYKRLSADLIPYVRELSALKEAKEQDSRQDLTILNRPTGWDARLIALAAMTERLSADPEINLPQEAVYGLLRAGLPSDKFLLARVEPDVAEQALKTVRDAGIVALSDREIERFKGRFQDFVNVERLKIPALGSKSTYGELLNASGLPPDVQNRFADVYFKHRGNAAQLWEEARKPGPNDEPGLKDEEIGKLQLLGKFAFLTDNSKAMTVQLMGKKISAPSELVEQGFHRADAWRDEFFVAAGIPLDRQDNLTKDEWDDLNDLIPTVYAAENVEDRLLAYAEDMARKVRLSYPTHVVARLLETDDKFKPLASSTSTAPAPRGIDVDSDRFDAPAARDVTVTLLKSAAAQGFRLGAMPVAAFLKTHTGITAGMTETEIDAGRRQLQKLQRVYQITPCNEAMPVLEGLGLTSAYDVMRHSENRFVELFNDKYKEIHHAPPAADVAPLVYRKSRQVSSITYNLFTIAKKMESDVQIAATSGPMEVRESVRDELIKQYPTMESLFGSMDYCACEHCRSVLSPAAYLVDLLQFLDTEPDENDDAAMKPYDALIERRPDLPHIPLTCQNTLTALPYIDIVNEILEYYVAHGKLEEKAARDTGDATTAELLAEPQNVIREAYDAVRNARYPLNLPFDLWIETARQFCNYFEMPLDRVLNTFRQADDLFSETRLFDRFAIFMESLGLSPAELEIFKDSDPLADDKWYELYGFPTEAGDPLVSDAPETLKFAKLLSRRLGVTYKELVEIIQTGFVNPKLVELALLYKLGIAIQDALLYRDYKPLYEQNKDLIGKDRDELSLADQQRLDALSKKVENRQLTDWEIISEVAEFEDRLNDLGAEFPLNDLQSSILSIPYDKVLVLADPDAGPSFDLTTLRYASGKKAGPIVFLRINLFVRLWRKLGWSIEETDRALSAFIPQTAPFDENPVNLAKQPLKTALIYLSHLKTLDEKIKAGKQSRLKLLTLWSNIGATGKKPLYSQLFLTRSALKSGEVEVIVDRQPRSVSVFDHPLGRYLVPAELTRIAEQVRYEVRLDGVKSDRKIDEAVFAGEQRISLRYDALGEAQYLAYIGVLSDSEKARLAAVSPSDELSKLLDAVQVKAREFTLIKGHTVALQGALSLTADEIVHILADSGKSLDTAELSLPNVSLLYRYGLLAKALKLSVREMISLKQLSGINPFEPLHPDPLAAIDQDHPFSETLRFVEIAKEVKDSGLKIEDLEYLLRHRFDETGKYRPNREGTLALLKMLSEGVRAIRIEHAVPEDPGALSEEVLRQKLGLVLPPDVAARFVSIMNGSAEFTAAIAVENEVDLLYSGDFVDEPAIRRLAYNQAKKEQEIVFRGLLFDEQKADLMAKLNPKLKPGQQATFAGLLNAVQEEAKQRADEFFVKHLKKQPLNQSVTTGFLDPLDFDLLLAPMPSNLSVSEQQERRRRQLARLAQAFFPYLQERLIRQLVVQTLTTHTGAEAVLIESLLTDQQLLATRDSECLLRAFTETGGRGMTATYWFSADRSGVALTTLLRSDDGSNSTGAVTNPVRSAGTDRAELIGYLEAPSDDNYEFAIVLAKAGDEAELYIGDSPNPVIKKVATQDGEEVIGAPVALEKGKRYQVQLIVKGRGARQARLTANSATLPKATYNSCRVEGYLEAPAPGVYCFYIELDKQSAEAELRFNHLPDPVFLDNTTLNKYLELKPGILYRFTLDLKNLSGGGARLLAQGETLPKDGIAKLTLYPSNAIAAAESAILLLTKSLQIAQSLGLSEREIRYLLTHADKFDDLNLKTLPVRDAQHALDTIAARKMEVDNTLSKAQAILQARNENPDLAGEADLVTPHFKQFLRLAAYARLKLDLAEATDDLIAIFEANEAGDLDKVYKLIAQLTRRDEATVKVTARALVAAPSFESEKPLARLWDALQFVERFSVPAASLLEWTRIVSNVATPAQRFEIARDLKEAVKARFEPEAWQRVAQPIFDKLRQRQRDALASHVMRREGFARMEQLYEYFLIDPGMEPVVRTSRIRLAIASVQLFVQRCLLNMEKKVRPTAIKSKQWEWMKRYRVWEANRKIFLYPENWLEPEFRDDKTHLFTELEGALLQGDVSSDLVEDAFLNYLKKLDELARLDIVAMHIEDNSDSARHTLHVFGRTFSQPHKYFYRRYSNEMWTPWEPVSAEIEGDHLAPVVWRDRLYLFWVTFMDKSSPEAMPTVVKDEAEKEKTIADLTMSDAVSSVANIAASKLVEVQLHWSEYLQGRWTTGESGKFFQVRTFPSPTLLVSSVAVAVPRDFNRSEIFIHVSKDEPGEGSGVKIHLNSPPNNFQFSFYLAGRNALPEQTSYHPSPSQPYNPSNESATRYSGAGALTVQFKQSITTWPGKGPRVPNLSPPQQILREGSAYTLLPCDNDLTKLSVSADAYQNASDPEAVQAAIESGLSDIASLIKPVFYQDATHTFFVEPDVTERTVEEWREWITPAYEPERVWQQSDWWKEDLVVVPQIPRKGPFPDGDPWRSIDPGALINPIQDRDWLVNPGTGLLFDGAVIGPAGRPGVEILTGGVTRGAAAGEIPVHVNPGSDLAAGSAAVLTGDATLEQAGLAEVAGGLNIVGGGGFNSTLAQNFNEFNRAGFGAKMAGVGRIVR